MKVAISYRCMYLLRQYSYRDTNKDIQHRRKLRKHRKHEDDHDHGDAWQSKSSPDLCLVTSLTFLSNHRRGVLGPNEFR